MAAGGGSQQYVLTGLTGGTQYGVQVRAVNAAGVTGPWSATAIGTTAPPVMPGMPRGLTAGMAVDEARVHLSWTAPISRGGARITGLQDRVLGRRRRPVGRGVRHDRRRHQLHRRRSGRQWSHVWGRGDAALPGFRDSLRGDGPAFQRGHCHAGCVPRPAGAADRPGHQGRRLGQ